MPTLFISYKRGTTAVAPLMERLQAAHYRLWFDRDEIHLGDPDWQARIDQGLQRCDGVILNITPAACQSEPVRYEVKKARELGKPIFPIILERITDYDAAIRDLGLADKQHIEDFTEWDEQIQRLLRDLESQGLRVTRHERRQQRDHGNPMYVLHQRYLKQLVERIGTLNLAQIDPDNSLGVELERVYVDSPTGLSLSVEVQDWQVVDWRISEVIQEQHSYYEPGELGYETAPFEALLNRVDMLIADYRQKYPQSTPDKEFQIWGISWTNGTKNDVIYLHLNHLAAACNRLVILGAPGSGKSTFVKFLALCLAGSAINGWSRATSIQTLENWPHGALTPIYIELRHFVASSHFPADIRTPVTTDHLWAYIQHEVLGEALAAYADDLRYDLEHGNALLLLDGLDEVPYPEGKLKQRQQQLSSLAQSLNTRYVSSRIIVASRPYAYAGWTLPGFQAVTIAAFGDEHRIALASRLYQTVRLDEETAEKRAKALNRQLGNIDYELKDRPLFVTLMATLYLRGDSEGLPTRRGALYRESILLLLDRWTTSKAGMSSLVGLLGDKSLDDLYDRLAALAYEVHNSYGDQLGTPEIDESLLYKHLKPLGRTTAAELIPYLSENAGVLVSPGQDEEKDVFHFAHRTFQEYMAAVHLIRLCAEANSFSRVRELIISKPQVWRVATALAGDELSDTDRRGDLWNLLDDLLGGELVSGLAADDPRWWPVWLASVILNEQKMITGEKLRHGEKAISDHLRSWIMALFETPQALDDYDREVCGRALSLLGDLRPGIGTFMVEIDGQKIELPQLEWCDVPAPTDGVFIMGADGQPDNPRHQAELKHSFKIAKYIITYQQFQTFVDSGEYDQPDWWVGFPLEYQPQAMVNQSYPYRNHPRDNVTWYQMVAFCRWLTVKYRASDLVKGEVEIRLPTEQEWEYAARGMDEHPDDLDTVSETTLVTDIGMTSAVGLFPDGTSPFGVLDMSGNVFQWCLNDYSKPEIVAAYGNGERKVVRGCPFYLKTTYPVLLRLGFEPELKDPGSSFRVVCASSESLMSDDK